MKFAETGVSVCVDDFGEKERRSVSQRAPVIYINQQHPLYQREVKKPETYILNVARLIIKRSPDEGHKEPPSCVHKAEQTPARRLH